MEIINNENCSTCNNILNTNQKEKICEVFNISVEMYEFSTMKYGCNSYLKDVKKMVELPKDYQFESKKYILWDTQFSEKNAQFSRATIIDRVPESDARILKVNDEKDEIFGIYVKKAMSDG